MTETKPAALSVGQLYNAIAALPPDQAAAVHALPQAERERIMAMDDVSRGQAIAALLVPAAVTEPVAATSEAAAETETATKKKGK